MTDEEWMLSLKGNIAYQGLDVGVEMAKCKAWCEAKQLAMSRRRFVNWLNTAAKDVRVPAKPPVTAHLKGWEPPEPSTETLGQKLLRAEEEPE